MISNWKTKHFTVVFKLSFYRCEACKLRKLSAVLRDILFLYYIQSNTRNAYMFLFILHTMFPIYIYSIWIDIGWLPTHAFASLLVTNHIFGSESACFHCDTVESWVKYFDSSFYDLYQSSYLITNKRCHMQKKRAARQFFRFNMTIRWCFERFRLWIIWYRKKKNQTSRVLSTCNCYCLEFWLMAPRLNSLRW